MNTRSVLVVDDEEMFRRALVGVVSASDQYAVVGEAADGGEAITLAATLNPAVTLMDVRMPGVDGIEATSAILAANPAAKVVAISTFITPESVVPMLRAGAVGYLDKSAPHGAILAAIDSALAGTTTLSPDVAAGLAAAAQRTPRRPRRVQLPDEPLSPAENAALDLLACGRTNTEIAAELGISAGAVKSRLHSIAAKFGVKSRIQILVRAIELGLIEPTRVTSTPS